MLGRNNANHFIIINNFPIQAVRQNAPVNRHALELAEKITHPCQICNVARYHTKRNLVNHILEAHNRYFCEECDDEFGSQTKLTYHISKHRMEFKCTYENCNFAHHNRPDLELHILKHSGGGFRFSFFSLSLFSHFHWRIRFFWNLKEWSLKFVTFVRKRFGVWQTCRLMWELIRVSHKSD